VVEECGEDKLLIGLMLLTRSLLAVCPVLKPICLQPARSVSPLHLSLFLITPNGMQWRAAAYGVLAVSV
jgi:hypothetical protein